MAHAREQASPVPRNRHADGTNGDTVLLGRPFVVTDEDLRR